MIRFLKYYFVFFIFLLIGVKAFAKNIEIPISELSQAIKNTDSGDTIYILSGVYKDKIIQIKKQFTKNVVIRPKTFGSVTLKGKITFRLIDCKRITIEGFLFQETSGSAIILNQSKEIEIYNNYFYKCGTDPNHSIIRIVNGSSDNIIDYNTFDDNRSQGILIATYDDNQKDQFNTGNQIFRNRFCNIAAVNSIYPEKGRNGMDAIMIGFSSDKTLNYALYTQVYQNLFENIIGDGWEIISNKTSNNIISENTFLNNRSGISIRSGNNVKIINNFLYNTTKGIRIFGYGHLIRNNLIANSLISIRLPSTDFSRTEKSLFVGYFQQDSILIDSNFIINFKDHAIALGENSRKLQPKNIDILNNTIYFSDRRKVLNTVQNNSVKRLSGNKYLQYDDDENKANFKKIQEIWHSRILDPEKSLPFNHLSKVGSDWKKVDD